MELRNTGRGYLAISTEKNKFNSPTSLLCGHANISFFKGYSFLLKGTIEPFAHFQACIPDNKPLPFASVKYPLGPLLENKPVH